MARTPNPYTPLGGTGIRWIVAGIAAARSRLWLGADHLLVVESSRNTEEYRRFYFRDIEAIVVRRTGGRQLRNWFLVILALLTVSPFLIAWRSEGTGNFFVIAMGCAVFWLIFILINSLRGPTCEAHIRTAVQLEPLPSLNRLSKARKALARLQPLILSSQGEATPEELINAPWMGAEGVRSATEPRPRRTEKGLFHGALFGLLIAEGVVTGLYFALAHEPLSAPGLLVMLAGFIVNIVALLRENNSDVPDSLRVMTKCAIVYYVLKCLAGFVFTMLYVIHHEQAQVITGLEMVGEPGFAEASTISATIGAIIGLIGLILLLGHRRSDPPAPAGS